MQPNRVSIVSGVVVETSNLSKAHETRDSSCSQVVLVYLHPFCRISRLKGVLQPEIALNPVFFGGRGKERGFRVVQGH